ncbi:HMA2 domain-containing protein [Peptostreptococcus canis]|uniref:HMA domain-containing protein n=1 Tax=Peptostreptococcus canis TaxID=1159213 RepID=A0ABR6TLC9_9FIRM|nr:hypothetical protein [Peptostreptococcus canis]MBC2576209.1 hypothetical protein [Peptostreptococcus canis]MBP1998256.1 copper chaperone CopZ [Peptostreptococcus canis]
MLVCNRGYICTLFLLASILGKNKKGSLGLYSKNKLNTLELPSFKNILEVRSSVNGRIRFFVPVLKSNLELAELLTSQVKKISVIKKCEVNLVTGSVLVEYDSDNLDAQTLEGVIMKLLSLDEKLDEGRTSEIEKKVGTFKNAINNGVYDFTGGILNIKSLMALLFLGAAVYDVKKMGARRTPDYITFLWWTTTLFM